MQGFARLAPDFMDFIIDLGLPHIFVSRGSIISTLLRCIARMDNIYVSNYDGRFNIEGLLLLYTRSYAILVEICNRAIRDIPRDYFVGLFDTSMDSIDLWLDNIQILIRALRILVAL